MNYKRVIAHKPNVSVLFELDDGRFALVGLKGPARVSISEYSETFTKFGGFESGNPSESDLTAASKRLNTGKVFEEERF